MSKKIYVGNLSYTLNDQSLSELFAQYGAVTSARIVIDRETGRSKGFGFVEMSKDEEAEQAISALNGTQFGGRTLTVNEARPREEGAPRSNAPRGGGFGGGPRQGGGGFNRERNGNR